MDDRELPELKDPHNWDLDAPVTREGVKNPRAVVSVSLAREDLELVARVARMSGMKTSEFIREASLERARDLQYAGRAVVYVSGEFRELFRRVGEAAA